MRRQSAFEIYLRTALLSDGCSEPVEVKFNPWHDPKNGRFTFAGQGNSSGGGTQSNGSSSTARKRNFGQFSPRNPRNYTTDSVRRGETLTSIAATRKGLRASDLAWLNDMHANQPLRVGQQLKLPNQNYLDAGRTARQKLLGLAYYMDTHDRHLPPDVANPPSIETQIEAQGVRSISKNGYGFDVDALSRTRHVAGEIRLEPESRSRTNQANAGGSDRRGTDEGGHYIAARFNGPRDWFNHFAQDANFNRGAYRALEDQWAKAVRSGKGFFVDIVPQYQGTSKRPYKLIINWISGGREATAQFRNEKKGR